MSSRSELLDDLRKQRGQREEKRRHAAEAEKGAALAEAAVLHIQRVYRGTAIARRWRDAEWQSLQKQVQDLDHLAELMRQKGQRFLAPCKVLVPLLCRAHRAQRQPSEELAELCGRLSALAAAALRAPLQDGPRSLCALLDEKVASPPQPHQPEPGRQVLLFARAALLVATAARGAAGAAELAELLDAQAWGEGRALQASAASRQLAGRLLGDAMQAPTGGQSALTRWRSATVGEIGAWRGGSTSSPRLQGLVDVSRAWLRLADTGPVAAAVLQAVISIPRVAGLVVSSQARVGGAHLPWSWILKSFAKALKTGTPGVEGGNAGNAANARSLDREYRLIYASGNLWEIHTLVGLPLEPLLCVQALLTENLEISMLPGAPADVLDETAAVRSLRQQLRHLADPAAISHFFGQALHLRPSQTGGTGTSISGAVRPYQQHLMAVVEGRLSPTMVEALCTIYSTLFLKARAVARAAPTSWGPQVFHSLANVIAYMDSGTVGKVLWRFASAFYDWRQEARARISPSCYHVLHVHATVLSQLLGVMSHDELFGSGSPFSPQDLVAYISLASELTSRLICDDQESPGLGSPPRGAFLEAFLEQMGRTLNQLYVFLGRQPAAVALPTAQDWHAPTEVLQDFRRCAEQMFRGQGLELPAPGERLMRHIPQCVPFDQRVMLLRAWILKVREQSQGQAVTRLVVRRTHLFEDGLAALANADWRSRFQVVFVNAAGLQEQGQDAGGLFKEFWEKLAETAFNPDYGLFRVTDSRLLFPNPLAAQYHERTDRLLQFLGMVIGKAIFEGIVVEPCFAPFFLSKLLGRHNSYYDLQSLDPSLFANLQRLKAYDGDVADLCCSFVTSTIDGHEVPLLPDGDQIAVTNDNRFKYIYAVAEFKLNTELKAGSDAFRVGFLRLVDERWLRIFSEDELQQVISGSQGQTVDIDDWQRHTHLSNCSGPKDKVVVDLFSALRAMNPEHRVKLLRFVTSCSRTPLLGFGHLVPPFTVHKVPIRSDSERLPTASTCFNTLKLPTYSSWKVMKEKLEFVLAQAAGFELD